MQRNKTLVSIVIVLGIIIIVGVALLGYGLVQRFHDPEFKFFKSNSNTIPKIDKIFDTSLNALPTQQKKITIPLNKGEWISEMETSENKIIIYVTNKEKNDYILILNSTDGSIILKIYFGQSN
jgi:hypothetical protein